MIHRALSLSLSLSLSLTADIRIGTLPGSCNSNYTYKQPHIALRAIFETCGYTKPTWSTGVMTLESADTVSCELEERQLSAFLIDQEKKTENTEKKLRTL